MKRPLLAVAVAGLVAATALALTNAFFSDEETSSGNTLQAGALDLKVDNTSYYNGIKQVGEASTSWDLRDLTVEKFFNFTDIKPGDWGEDTISIHVDTNDAWACYDLSITKNADNGCTEPEKLDDQTCDPASTNNLDGELAQNVNFVFWADDGDNVLETEEEILTQGPIYSIMNGLKGALADSLENNLGDPDGQPLPGLATRYIAKAWCFGTLTTVPLSQDGVNNARTPEGTPENGGITCDGSGLNNATQTDIVTADISFSAIQARNNAGYVCYAEPTPTNTPTPTPTLACIDDVLYASYNTSQDQGTLKNSDLITNPARIIPSYMLGAPDGAFFSIGLGGEVVVAFDGIVQDKDGPDISVHEITGGRDTYPEEKVEVFVSNDDITYASIGFASSEPGGGGDGVTYLDINGALSNVKYVKLVDATDFTPHLDSADGYDIDAIDAAFGLCK